MARMQLAHGTTIDGFTIGPVVHKGGMAIFYEVTRPDQQFPLIMKVPFMRDGEDPAAIVGFEMETMILPRLSGRHVPRFVAAGDFATQPYLVFERIVGSTLYSRLEALPLPPDDVAALGARIANALHDLHGQHVIHLDIKPSNIMVRDSDGEVVLIDYGLSRHDQLPDLMDEEFHLPYGTAPYMAPEQAYGIRTDPRSDVFALGVLMYFFTTGTRPFGDPQSLRGLKRRVWDDPVPPRRLVPTTPPWLQEIILRCLAPDPEARHPTAAQLAMDLANPGQVRLTPRADKLARDPATARIKRRFHPESYRPVVQREKHLGDRLSAAPIVVAALDLSQTHRELTAEIGVVVGRILKMLPGARLACLNVQRLNLITPDEALDAAGHSIHVQRLVALRAWALALGVPDDRLSCHVLEAVDPGAAILGYITANPVDHVVLGATTRSGLRNILGSVATEIAQKAPCTVTIVRKARTAQASELQSGAAEVV